MIINLQQLIALLPVLILIVTVIISMLSIAYNRNHSSIYILSVLGLITSFCSLFLLISIIPINITQLLYIDRSSILYISMIIFSSITTCIFAYSWLDKYLFNKEEFYLLILFSTIGSIALIISNHMSSLFINIELTSLPIFGLIAYSNYQKYSLEASFKYILLSGVSSSFLLFGIAWVYAISGDLSFTSVNSIFNTVSLDKQLVMLFGISMILLSLFFKLSIVPFHLWTPDIYQGAPSLVLSFFSTASKISIFSILLHFFPCISYSNNKIIYCIILLIICLSILIGNFMAIFQKNIKRFFGYSSISQLGYLLIILLTSKNHHSFALETSGIYLLSYLFSNIAYFGIIHLTSNINQQFEFDALSYYRGLFWSQPFLSILLTIILLSLAGIPMTLGFIGKFYLLSIIITEHLWIISFFFLVGTLLGIYSYLRIIINLYLSPVVSLENTSKISNFCFYTPSGIVIFISSMMLLVFGIYPNPLISLVRLSQLY